jgi:hypothetical protein
VFERPLLKVARDGASSGPGVGGGGSSLGCGGNWPKLIVPFLDLIDFMII